MARDEYDIDGLKHGIEQCKKHKKSLEEAIAKETNTIKEYKIMIDALEKKKAMVENMKNNVEIVHEE